mgnify:CR=1 FL=1
MWKQKDPTLHTIEEVVMKNTGLSKEELLNDEKEYQIRDVEKVIEVLNRAAKEKIFVTVIGDYDTDGVTSSSEWELMLKAKNIPHRIRLPKRHLEGYGLNEKIIDEIETGIVLTVDNGIAAIPAIKKAKDKGLYVIVVDHHQPVLNQETKEVILPEADIIIDPHAIKGQADFDYYCGAGLTYKVAEAWFGKDHYIMKKLSSLAAIGTVGDVVELKGDNRKIVRSGLKNMLTKEGRTIGLLKLMQTFNLSERVTAEDIGFSISPAINACGRLGAPVAPKEEEQPLELLTFSGSFDEAQAMAEEIAGRNLDGKLSVNETRKRLVKAADKKAEEIISENAMYGDCPLVIHVPEINEGIIGIVAGHLLEKYGVPAIVFTNSSKDPNVLKGSGRSIPSVNLKELLDTCADDLIGYGGHPGAAGLSIVIEKLDEFRMHLQENVGEIEYEEKGLTYDLEITEKEVETLIPELDKYGPYGQGNPQPVFLIKNYKLFPKNSKLYQVSGSEEEHVSFFGLCTKANAFWLNEKYKEIGQPKYLNIIGTLDVSYYKKEPTYGIKVLDMEPAPEPEKKMSKLARKIKERTMEASHKAEVSL